MPTPRWTYVSSARGRTSTQSWISRNSIRQRRGGWTERISARSSFRCAGWGGGTFHSRHLGELEGFKEGTPEFARLFGDYLSQIETHLRERNWLSKAFTYWFDEPAPKDFEFVAEGMKRLHAAAPGIKRMLTVEPEPPLAGTSGHLVRPDPQMDAGTGARTAAGGRGGLVYICCGPHAPYVTEFIDHPGTELRLWPWQSWQYGVRGILIWETTYWTSSAAFPPPNCRPVDRSHELQVRLRPEIGPDWLLGQRRWAVPLSPRREPAAGQPACLEAPSIRLRWENLRDGWKTTSICGCCSKAWSVSLPAGRNGFVSASARALEGAGRGFRGPDAFSRPTRAGYWRVGIGWRG